MKQITALEEKQLMQKYFIVRFGVRSSILDCVIETLKELEKQR